MSVEFLEELDKVIAERKSRNHSGSYTASLFNAGLDKILQKVGEESIEFILDSKTKIENELPKRVPTLLFHFMVALQAQDLSISDIVSVLANRHKTKLMALLNERKNQTNRVIILERRSNWHTYHATNIQRWV